MSDATHNSPTPDSVASTIITYLKEGRSGEDIAALLKGNVDDSTLSSAVTQVQGRVTDILYAWVAQFKETK